MKTSFLSILLLFFVLMPGLTFSQVQDIDGNHYETVEIGGQTWIAENLRVSRFNNGTEIPEAGPNEEWSSLCNSGKPAWCYYNNDPVNGNKFGKLYNQYVVTDTSLNICPLGWKVPDEEEWFVLFRTLGGLYQAGIELMDTQSGEWNYHVNQSFSSVYFNAMASGYRDGDIFSGKNYQTTWWSPDPYVSFGLPVVVLYWDTQLTFDSNFSDFTGYAIRCVKN